MSFNIHWIIELGGAKERVDARSNSLLDLEQISLRSKGLGIKSKSIMIEQADSIQGPEKDKNDVSILNFENKYKPLQDINFSSVGEKCFMLLDKKVDISNSENKKEKLVMADFGQFVLMEVANSKKPGIKNVFFNSLIQVKSELNFEVKLQLESEYNDKTVYIDLGQDDLQYVPVRYCTTDTTMTLHTNNERVTAVIEESLGDNEIKFGSFFSDSQQFTNISNYYFSGDSKNWDKISQKDTMLVVSTGKSSNGDKSKVLVSSTIYRKKIYVSNRGNQKEYAYAFLITLRPIIIIKNATPRNLELRFNSDKISYALDTNEKHVFKGASNVDEKTSIRVKIKDSSFRESSPYYPLEYNNKKVRIASIYMVDEKGDGNRLFLKVEVRRYSSHHIKCFIYCPFLIYNETNYDLYYKSHVYFTKVNKHNGGNNGLEFEDQWNQLVEEFKEETRVQENVMDTSEHLMNSTDIDPSADEFYVRMCKNFEMYSPDKVPQSLRISTSISHPNWSNAFIMRFKECSSLVIRQNKSDSIQRANEKSGEGVIDKHHSHLRRKLKFLVYVDQLSGLFFRSKLIMIQPYYIIKNVDETISFAVTQCDLLDYKISIKPQTATSFNWPHKDAEESLVIAQVESASNTLQTDWSRKFKIDMPGQFTVKCTKAGIVSYITVIVYHDENSPYYITLCRATKESLPIKIVNETKYEINLSQVFLDPKKKILPHVPKGEVINVKPCSVKMFAWDENCPPFYLKVQVEDSEKIYAMDSVKDLEPLVLKGLTNKEHRVMKHYLRGYLKRRNIYDERETDREEYCILNFSKQTLKIYPTDSYPTMVKLQNAQIDEDFQRNEFVLVYAKESFYFQCKNSAECKLWVNSLLKAKNLYQEDTIFIKTEPTEHCRVLTFYKAGHGDKEEQAVRGDKNLPIEK